MSAYYTTVARFYDAETGGKTDDLLMYSELAAEYGEPVLDVGCGTGRVLLHLGQEGYKVHGIDNDRAMLDRFDMKLKAMPHLKKKVTYTEGDVMTYTAAKPYKLVLLTYNALMHFHTQEKQIALLSQLHTLTDKKGRLILDLPNAGDTFASQDSDSMILDRTFIDEETGHLIMLQSVSYLDRTAQLMRVQWIYDEIYEDGTVKRLFAPHLLRYYFYPEMQLLLKATGFEIEDVFGDVDESPFEDGSERMVIYARPV